MDQRPWWERMFDRDSAAGPVIVLVLLILVIGFVLTIGPILDRLIAGEQPDSYLPAGSEHRALRADDYAARAAGRSLGSRSLELSRSSDALQDAALLRAYRHGTNAGGQHGNAA